MEQRGIELVSAEERYGRPRDLLFLWSGTTMGIFTLVYGTVIISLGLSFVQAICAIVIGNLLAFPLVGLTSLQGPETGTATMAVSRAAYGPKGARVLSFFGWLNMVGFEAGGMVLITFASLSLLEQAGVTEQSLGLKVAVILVAALIQLVLPLIGHSAVMKAQKYFTWVFLVLFGMMAILVGPKVSFAAAGEGADFAMFTVAVALVMSAGGLSWGPLGGDYSRYLPKDSSKKAVFGYAFLGGFAPYVLLMTLGAAVATVVKEAGDPISGLPGALPSWFVVPYLVLAIVSLFAVNTTDLYSSGLNLQAAGVKIKRWVAVVADLVLCVIITYVAVTSDSFNEMLNTFLGLLILWLAPWAGIYVTDWLRRKGRYDAEALFDESAPGQIRWPAIIAQVVGMVAAALWINSTAFVGPISAATGGSDFSIFAGFLVAGAVYAALDRRPAVQLERVSHVSA